MKKIFAILGICISIVSCKKGNYEQTVAQTTPLHKAYEQLTEVMIHDIFSPPVASRIYAYSSLAAYEAALPLSHKHQSLAGQIRGFRATPPPQANQKYCYQLASFRAFLVVARTLTFTGTMFDEFEKSNYQRFEDVLPSGIYERSIAYGDSVAKHVMKYASTDNYKQTRGLRYSIENKPATWVPTPPAYMDAVEPRWRTIRSFTLDSAAQFMPQRPTPFSTEKNSQFYKEAIEVYEIGKKLSEQQTEIANFWDCNPFKMNVSGHAMFATKKMSPGGHWLGIVGLVCRKQNLDWINTSEAYLRVSIGLFDGFISCWDEKYRSVLTRPETYINTHIDPKWQPLLQTPPFPEYTSGHSVISNASAIILENLLGNNFAFADSSEIPYGLPVRSFTSLRATAAEASISRLYGGIHYLPAINNGAKQGEQVGSWVIKKLKTKK